MAGISIYVDPRSLADGTDWLAGSPHAGCITPLLSLVTSSDLELSAASACILSWLSEGGLAVDRLSQDSAISTFVRVLQSRRSDEVTIGAPPPVAWLGNITAKKMPRYAAYFK